ncbi:MAG: Phosphoesterase DHHA1 [Cenarchaeum symbiont of Oopsacas minuta]|nr:Phosphoesterase DHHA1 [Cenarchaeum symbiont of Oopsacas minuta]
MQEDIGKSFSYFADTVHDAIKAGKTFSIITHTDCDGLTSASILASALVRSGAKFTVRTTSEFEIETIKSSKRDVNLITDLGSNHASEIESQIGGEWFVLDHHHVQDSKLKDPRIINSWKFGIDGGMEACSGTMAYMAAMSLDSENIDLSRIAVVAAIGDRQDVGERKSLLGKNATVLKTAVDAKLVEINQDLLLVGRETRQLADAMAFTARPFIEGVTWNHNACIEILKSCNIPLKSENRWRVPSELSQEEKNSILASLAEHAHGDDASAVINEMIGNTYTLTMEEPGSCTRDAREFSTMLNSCARIGMSGLGITICMGERGQMLKEAEKVLEEYRSMIKEYMNTLSGERWRIRQSGICVMIDGGGLVPENMTGTVSSVIAGSPKNAGKIVILRTNSKGNSIKFSSRKSSRFTGKVSLNKIMQAGAEKFDGTGGGHDGAASARITRDKLDGFLDYLETNVANVQNQDNNP